MKIPKTNFDLYIEEQMKDTVFRKNFLKESKELAKNSKPVQPIKTKKKT